MSRASPALAVPPVKRYDELRRIPLDVWLDAEGRVRRLRHEAPSTGMRVDLVAHGVPLDVDWSRIPGTRD